MYKNIFDTHAHYLDEAFSEDMDNLLTALPAVGICHIINCATDTATSKESLSLAGRYSYISASCGIHPEDCADATDADISSIKNFCLDDNCVAVGEIGLDYHYDYPSREKQLDIFEKQLIIAKELELPVIIHDRDAHMDTWNLLKKYRPAGVLHCFSGSVEMAKDIISIGMYIGLGGAVTFKNARKPVEVAEYVPEDRLLLETDCPYMSPVPFRGQRNNSSLIASTAEFIAAVKGIKTQELLNTTKDNAVKLFL